jgi:exonuclease SbcC
MRPVRLRMHGFAAFREPTEVDFTGVEYFALVGPTGSGKSTVIDAMTFALYGSVPRWGNKGVVSLALSPSTNRGTVALEFDVNEQRYLAARDLRRSASGSVTVREARLERVPARAEGTAEVPETEVLAHGGAVTKAVEELLGLPFDQFCMCVVLPQGEFAQFLRAAPAERQKVLTGILGLNMYEQMAKEAGQEAKELGRRAELLAEQLGGYAEATEQAAAEAGQRVDELTALVDRLGTALAGLGEHDAAVAAAEGTVARLTEERGVLVGLTVPEDVDQLGPAARRLEQALTEARRRVADAEEADTGARERQARAPDPEPLRRQRAEHAELARLHTELPTLQRKLRDGAEATERARAAATEAEAERDRARAARDEAEAAMREREVEGRRLADERRLLAEPSMPDGVAELDRAGASGAAALTRAREELTQAEAADELARQAVANGPDRARLLQARREHTELAEAEQLRREADQRGKLATARLHGTEADLARAEQVHVDAMAARVAAQRSDLVGALRPTLVAHQPCPVCEQDVVELPAPAVAADLAAAEHAVRAATAEQDRARVEQRAAADAVQRTVAEVAGLTARIGVLRAGLAGTEASIERVDERLDLAERLATEARVAEQRAVRARAARAAAERDHEVRRDRQAAAERALRAARDPLVALGAPSVEIGPGQRLAAGWLVLTEWAGAEVAGRDEQLTGLRAQFVQVRATHTEADRAGTEAGQRLERLRTAAEAALRAEQDAAGALTAADRRRDELTAALRDAPDPDELDRRLTELDQLAAAIRSADAELRAARAALAQADRAARQQADRVQLGWRELRAARDRLVALGAPAQHGSAASSGAELVDAWRALAGWAAGAAAERADRLTGAGRELAEATERRDRAHHELRGELRAHGVEPAPDRPLALAAAPAAVSALEQARAEVRRIADYRARAARLIEDQESARQAEQVARMLADLLRSNNFPRWLVTSALDALVVDASRSLAELSGGQFELDHSDGEFVVIDHADADARRPVKTLSGGETFQASLALALALSEQLATLASAGAARLDSIFLDEGFGTLDESNLDMVASTLENLASHRDRMVGVITHVPALAERVPVRFAVSRDQRTSTVTRENL